jgi:hypothetical protein
MRASLSVRGKEGGFYSLFTSDVGTFWYKRAMRFFLPAALVAVWPITGIASESILVNPEKGQCQKLGEKWVFVATDKDEDLGDFFSVVESQLNPHPEFSEKKVLRGRMGGASTGRPVSFEGVPIFIASGDERPILAGITDADGKFAISLSPVDEEAPQYIYFSGEVEIVPPDRGKSVIREFGKGHDPALKLKAGTRTKRYRILSLKS